MPVWKDCKNSLVAYVRNNQGKLFVPFLQGYFINTQNPCKNISRPICFATSPSIQNILDRRLAKPFFLGYFFSITGFAQFINVVLKCYGLSPKPFNKGQLLSKRLPARLTHKAAGIEMETSLLPPNVQVANTALLFFMHIFTYRSASWTNSNIFAMSAP